MSQMAYRLHKHDEVRGDDDEAMPGWIDQRGSVSGIDVFATSEREKRAHEIRNTRKLGMSNEKRDDCCLFPRIQ